MSYTGSYKLTTRKIISRRFKIQSSTLPYLSVLKAQLKARPSQLQYLPAPKRNDEV